MSSILEQLNDKQYEAAKQIEGPVLIIAGAGSGKTRTITYKIAHMVKEKNINPRNILALTFTNKAANEMKERAISLIGQEYDSIISISTFHSFSLKLLKQYCEILGYEKNFNVYDTSDQTKLLKDIIKECGFDKEVSSKDMVSKISRFKENLKTPDMIELELDSRYSNNNAVITVYKKYQEHLIKNNSMDFSDLLLNAYNLLKNEEILEIIQERYKYIIIDEYQDTNHLQYKMVKKIAYKYQNICVVGDDNQSIYKFRGADIENILNFEKDYNNVKIVKLEKNYRSTQTILNVANEVIKNNSRYISKNLYTDNEKGDKIRLYQAKNIYDEANAVSEKIYNLIKENENLKYSDFTILYRTNKQSRTLEENLRMYKIPHKVYGSIQFYQRKEIKVMLSYLILLNNFRDNLTFTNIFNVPKRGLGDKALEKIQDYANEYNISYYEAAKEVKFKGKTQETIDSFINIFESIKEEMNYLNIIEISKKIYELANLEAVLVDNKQERIDNLDELYRGMLNYIENSENPSLDDYLSGISLYSSIDDMNDENYVKLMTVHSSKGLEFNYVFIVGMEDGNFPLVREYQENEDEIDEERRLYYVALTRAKKGLFISYSEEKYSFNDESYIKNRHSRFIDEMPKEYLHFVNSNNYILNTKSNNDNNITEKKEELEIISLKNINCSLKKGDKVYHSKFNEGKVLSVDEKIVLVYFPIGNKKISTVFADKVLKKI